MQLAATTLTHGRVRLEPISERHRDGLTAAAAEPSIWRHMPFGVVQRGYGAFMDYLLAEQAEGRWMPFVVHLDGAIVGQSCYLNIRAKDQGVEIGGTWYTPEVQATLVNPTCKLLLLGHAFACGAERVELKTDSENARSRAAILKLGAQFEGVHRHHMKRPDGAWRDTAWYSVLREEWQGVRTRLEARIGD